MLDAAVSAFKKKSRWAINKMPGQGRYPSKLIPARKQTPRLVRHLEGISLFIHKLSILITTQNQ